MCAAGVGLRAPRRQCAGEGERERTMSASRLTLLATGCLFFALACGPDIPDDAEHRGATEADCVECHFYGLGLEPSDRHWEGDAPKDSYEDCFRCHDRQ